MVQFFLNKKTALGCFLSSFCIVLFSSENLRRNAVVFQSLACYMSLPDSSLAQSNNMQIVALSRSSSKEDSVFSEPSAASSSLGNNSNPRQEVRENREVNNQNFTGPNHNPLIGHDQTINPVQLTRATLRGENLNPVEQRRSRRLVSGEDRSGVLLPALVVGEMINFDPQRNLVAINVNQNNNQPGVIDKVKTFFSCCSC